MATGEELGLGRNLKTGDSQLVITFTSASVSGANRPSSSFRIGAHCEPSQENKVPSISM
jgi:hypothetical protein